MRGPASPDARALPGDEPQRRRDHGVPGGEREPAAGALVSDAAELVFVGGTGRSGTTVTAELLGRHSRFCDVPISAGSTRPERARRRCQRTGQSESSSTSSGPTGGTGWGRLPRHRAAGVAGGARSGAHRVGQRLGLGHDDSECAAYIKSSTASASTRRHDVRAGPRRRLLEASRRLSTTCSSRCGSAPGSRRLSDEHVHDRGRAGAGADLPRGRFVPSVRDGRDSGASKDPPREGAPPDRRDLGIDFWADRLRRAS